MPCTTCAKPVPTPPHVCPKCVETHDHLDRPTPTYYCSHKCRMADVPDHQTTCRNNIARTRLIRAGHILQGVFLMGFRYAAFDLKIKKVEREGGVLHFYEDEYTDEIGDGPAWTFLQHLVPNVEEAMPLLAYLACDDAMGYMLELSKELLGDFTTTIEEIKLRPNRPTVSSKVICHDPSGTPDLRKYGHAALAVECIDGEAYIIDMTGVQFGQTSPVVPFDEYMRLYACRVNHVHPHGTERAEQIAIRKGEQNHEHCDTFDFRIYHLQHKIHGFMAAVQRNWEKENKMTVKELLAQREGRFRQGWVSFVDMNTDWLTSFVETWRKCGCKLDKHPEQSIEPVPRSKKPKCTVVPLGVGSRAYRRWVEDNEGGHTVPGWLGLIDEMRAAGARIVITR